MFEETTTYLTDPQIRLKCLELVRPDNSGYYDSKVLIEDAKILYSWVMGGSYEIPKK